MGRPDRIRLVVDSYAWGDHAPVMLTLYENDARLSEYLSQKWPASWQIEVVPMRGNGPTYNAILGRYPNEETYGFLADDALLITPGMLAELEKSAGHWHIAYANDQHHGENIPTMPCIGGDLARAVGYLSPTHFVHWGIDAVWGEFGKRMGLLAYREDLIYEHRNPVWGTAPDDRTYALARQESFGFQDIFRMWLVGGGFIKARERVLASMREKAA
jgi:hypothetical protein